MPRTPRRERERRAGAGAQARICVRGKGEQRKWDETAREMVARRGARLRLDEGVVGDVEADDRDGRREEPDS